MNDPHRSNEFLRFTGDEADRLLNALDSSPDQDELISSEAIHSTTGCEDPYVLHDDQPQLSVSQVNPVNAFIQILSIVIFAFLVWSLSKESQVARTDSTVLGFRASCGSSFKASQRWWPVLGPPSPSLLSKIRSKYCGDAYINENNVLQVASFSSWHKANDFKNRLELVTGSSLRIGESVYR